MLLAAAEEAAFEHDRMMLRLEVREDNLRAIRIYEQGGYRKIGREPGYYEDGATALRYEKTLRGDIPVATKVPFYQQTCEFTCGPCCLMMAMANFDSRLRARPGHGNPPVARGDDRFHDVRAGRLRAVRPCRRRL